LTSGSAAPTRRAPTRRPPVVCPLAPRRAARWRFTGRAWAVALAQLLLCLPARADHELPFYPSFYPQQIKIETLDRAAALAGWSKARVHAYLGDDLFAGAPVPDDATPVASLASYVVLTFDATSGPYSAANTDRESRCAAAARILPRLTREGYVFHPYPVTPYHPDFLEQSDLAAQARARYATAPHADDETPAPMLRARGALAERLVPANAHAEPRGWDATIEEIDIDALRDAGAAASGDPPWAKDGWYQTYLLYAGQSANAVADAAAARMFNRLENGSYRDATEKINLERALVGKLANGCRRMVIGYTLRKQYFNSEYSLGVENVGFDSQRGFHSPIFPRTVKLKDFPWNGWLRIGVATAPQAAWNPIGGLNDAFGRLLWAAIGDPALLPDPHGGGSIDNRARIAAKRGPVPIPADAWKPEAGTGRLRAVGAGKIAQARLRYSLVTSSFHDGTHCDVADLVYPYIFAFRWGGRPADAAFDPVVAHSGARMRDWLAGFRIVGMETQTRNYGDDLKFTYPVPIIDVYLNHRLSDPTESALIAPPWSTLPWEVIVLMEEAVNRGIGAFSRDAAQRRGVPWLDLARDGDVGVRLAALVDEFQREGYRPESLRALVSVREARERWAALARFHVEHHHFLVTNGPYRLDSWTMDAAVLEAFRDFGYPLGVGEFDAYAIPLRAYVSSIEDRGDRLELRADVEQVVRSQRSYEIERVGYVPAAGGGEKHGQPRVRYVIVGPGASVVRAGTAALDPTGRFVIDLKHLGAPGRYTVAAAVFVGGNTMEPSISFIQHRVEGATATRQAASREGVSRH